MHHRSTKFSTPPNLRNLQLTPLLVCVTNKNLEKRPSALLQMYVIYKKIFATKLYL